MLTYSPLKKVFLVNSMAATKAAVRGVDVLE